MGLMTGIEAASADHTGAGESELSDGVFETTDFPFTIASRYAAPWAVSAYLSSLAGSPVGAMAHALPPFVDAYPAA